MCHEAPLGFEGYSRESTSWDLLSKALVSFTPLPSEVAFRLGLVRIYIYIYMMDYFPRLAGPFDDAGRTRENSTVFCRVHRAPPFSFAVSINCIEKAGMPAARRGDDGVLCLI